MSNNQGWIGVMRQVLYVLSIAGADRDENGAYKVYGERPVCAFMGQTGENAEVVVSGDAEYSVDGHRRNLAALLNSTSYGLAVKVY